MQPQQQITHTNESKKPRRLLGNQLTVGLVIILIGTAIMLRRIGVGLPNWLYGWEMILIIVGIFTGINSRFRDFSWLIPIIVGLVFLSDEIFPGMAIQKFAWPAGIIIVGLIIAFKPSFFKNRISDDDDALNFQTPQANSGTETASTSSPEVLDIAAIFGGVKRTIMSKNFRGGEVVSVFGGSELNLTHADFNGVIKLEVVNIFGGTKLIVPAHWEIQSDMVAILGGVDDKRIANPAASDSGKKLIISGVSMFGGLDIRSY